ncbi:TFIIB-type zinc ribbon-containing protein [Pseudonocardia asaccharolytica]|uniref:TFIIB-type zinc ribbon-containing protein n=1 Tax=Pseudonocardia asaccharolytica TaxID=54010 RepID=UPI0021C022DD|nr:zf-TFIIB domain-containing protein [Pseudonocardia asaccharolytica]
MICPKCQGRLRTVDRQGVHIEQCERCRGIFLDHGELEQMLRAEQHYYGAPPYRGRPDSPRPYRGHADSPPPYGAGRSGRYPDSPGPYGPGGHRRHSFLGDLFG